MAVGLEIVGECCFDEDLRLDLGPGGEGLEPLAGVVFWLLFWDFCGSGLFEKYEVPSLCVSPGVLWLDFGGDRGALRVGGGGVNPVELL